MHYVLPHVAVHNNGDIFVTDNVLSSVSMSMTRLEPRRQYMDLTVLVMDSSTNPLGIAVVGDVIFVSEFRGKRVQKLTTGGQFLFNVWH